MSSDSLDMSSLGYELYNFTNNLYTSNQRNFSDSNTLRYENGTNYHNLINDLISSLSNLTYFSERDDFNNDVLYWNENYSSQQQQILPSQASLQRLWPSSTKQVLPFCAHLRSYGE